METARRTRRAPLTVRQGFTLVEILIVVIILGILAAIVIPQFTNASEDARKSSLTSQVQTIRSQVQLYKMEHRSELPAGLIGAEAIDTDIIWNEMTQQTDADEAPYTGAIGQSGPYGPYLQSTPINPLNGKSTVTRVTTDVTAGGTVTDCGFVVNTETGKVWATNKDGTVVVNEKGEIE